MLGHCLVSAIVLLGNKSDGYCVSSVECSSVLEFLVANEEGYFVDGDGFCLSCACYCCVFARPACEEKCPVSQVGSVLGELVVIACVEVEEEFWSYYLLSFLLWVTFIE